MEQNGLVIWLFGLSGSGKSSIALLLESLLLNINVFAIRLDGDELRKGINKDLGFSDADRAENVRRTAEMARILSNNNVITICALITPLKIHRSIAKSIIIEKYFDVFVDCPLEVCVKRDVKGLYKKAFQHEIENFTGVDSAFERPIDTGITVSTDLYTAEECAMEVFNQVISRIKPL